jgi:hypothetical protein
MPRSLEHCGQKVGPAGDAASSPVESCTDISRAFSHFAQLESLTWTERGTGIDTTSITQILAKIHSRHMQRIKLCYSFNVLDNMLRKDHVHQKWQPLAQLLEGDKFSELRSLQICLHYVPISSRAISQRVRASAAFFEELFPRLRRDNAVTISVD